MKAFGNSKQFLYDFLLLFIVLIPFFLTTYACDNPAQEPPLLDKPGEFTKCAYTNDLSSSDFSSAVIFYPCEKNSAPYAASTLTGGWINTKEDMSWIADHLVTHGYILISMTPNNNMGNNEQWEKAHKAGLNKLISENKRAGSPINGLVDIENMQIMGFSKGGGGALLAAADMGDQVKSTQALAPYMDQDYELAGIRSATVCYSGSDDLIATTNVVGDIFNTLPKSIDRSMVILNKAAHLDWMNDGKYQDRFKTYITAWMKVHLNGETDYETFIKGSEEWVRDFKHFDANSNTESGGCD
jgi:dienelactone hydrolase